MTQRFDTVIEEVRRQLHARGAGRLVLCLVLVLALAMALVPAGMTRALADEPAAVEPAAEAEASTQEEEAQEEETPDAEAKDEPAVDSTSAPSEGREPISLPAPQPKKVTTTPSMRLATPPTTPPAKPTVAEITFKDQYDKVITKSNTDAESLDLVELLPLTNTLYVRAKSIVVTVTANGIDADASKSQVELATQGVIAKANFAQKTDDEGHVIPYVYEAVIDHVGDDPDDLIPEDDLSGIGLRVTFVDGGGTSLMDNESHPYQLCEAQIVDGELNAHGYLRIDRTGPEVGNLKLKYSGTEVASNGFYKSDYLNTTVTATGSLLDKEASKVLAKKPHETSDLIKPVDIEWIGISGNVAQFSLGDGSWDVVLQFYDEAGNVTVVSYNKVTLDGKPPFLQLNVADAGSYNSIDGVYHYANVGKATAQITEVSLDDTRTQMYLSTKFDSLFEPYDGFAYDSAVWQTGDHENYYYGTGVPINEDGFYRFEVHAFDQVGNEAASAMEFTLDAHEPTVEWQFLDDADAEVAPVTTYGETASDALVFTKPLNADFFNEQVKARATITDRLLVLKNSSICVSDDISESVTLKKLVDDSEATVGGVTIKLVSNSLSDRGVRTMVVDVVYPGDGVYPQPTVKAADYVHETNGKASDSVDYLVIDSAAPTIAASINADPADQGTTAAGATIINGAENNANRVFFFKSGPSSKVSLDVTELYGIRSFELVDKDGSERYPLSEVKTGLQSALEAGNANLATSGSTSSFAQMLLATLKEGVDLSDGMQVKVTDFAGHTTTWTIADGLTAAGGSIIKPTLIVEDNTNPELYIVEDIADKGTAAAAGHKPENVRYFNEAQTLGLEFSDLTIKYLRGFAGGAEGDEHDDIDGSFAGIDGDRPVMTIVKDGDAAHPQKLTVSGLSPNMDGKDYTLTHTFDEDGDYELTLGIKDATLNGATATVDKFTIDKTAPTIDVVYDNNDVRNGSYYAKSRTATITVVEHNFDPDLFEVGVDFKNHTKDLAAPTVSWTDSGDTHTGTVEFKEDGAYVLTVTGIDRAGNAAVLASDASVEGYDSGTFTIDTEKPVVAGYYDHGTAPTAAFDADDPVVSFPEPSGTFGGTNYYAHAISLPVKVKDRNIDSSDLGNALTLKVTRNGTEATRDVSWGRKPDERGDNGYEQWQTTVPYDEDGEYLTPHVTATDLAENTADNKTDKKEHDLVPFVVDLKPPTVKVNVDKKPASQGKQGNDSVNFYNQQTTMTFAVSDEHKLRSVEIADPDSVYNVSKEAAATEGKGSVTFTVSLKDGTVPKDNEYQRDIVLTAIDLAGNERTWTIDHTGKIKKDQKVSGAWKQVASSDPNVGINGGKEHPVSLVQDTVAPVVGLSGVEAGKYYNKAQTVTATVNELNLDWVKQFDPSRVVVTVTQYAGAAGRAQSSFTIPASSFTGNKPDYSFPQVFSSDGHYVVEAQFADYATNLSNKATIGEFTIDMTPPQITMDFDNKEVRNGKYYKATRTATITVTEHNFDPSLITIEAEGGTVGGWSNNGDTHTVTVFFGEGGPYTIKVNGKDMADNAATEVSEPEFIVDLTPPEVKIAGTAQRLGYVGDSSYAMVDGSGRINAYHGDLEDQSAYNGVVVPVITYTDNEELATDDLSFTLAGSKHGEDLEVESTTSEPGKEMTTTLADIGYQAEGPADGSNWQAFYVDDYSIDADDIYTIKAKLSDQAGNEAEGEQTFSVNRFGSNYDVRLKDLEEEELAEYQKSGMLSTSPTIVVREINVSGVENDSDHRVEKEFANATTAIQRADNEATGYSLRTIDPKKATNGWSEYVYTVRNTNFGEGSDSDHNDRGQGVYRVNVTSDDTASNANTTADYWHSNKARTKATAEGATAEFILDELGPTIDDVDLPERLTRGASYEASFHVTDDITSGNTVEVLVDGVKLAASEVQGPSNGAGTFTFQIPAKAFNWNRSVKIVVRDYAGREVSESNHNWMWLSSFIPEVGTVVGAIAVVAVGIAALLRRKAAAEPELPEW